MVSERDFFYKTAKVFGDDVQKVRKLLDRAGESRYTVNREHRSDGAVLRELKVELTTPRTFDLAADL